MRRIIADRQFGGKYPIEWRFVRPASNSGSTKPPPSIIQKTENTYDQNLTTNQFLSGFLTPMLTAI
jgi:hypothetical protein